MKIMHVLKDVRVAGNGIVNNTVDLACAQASAGHEVVVVSRGGGYESVLHDGGVAHVLSGAPTHRLRGLLLGVWRLWTVCRSLRPDIVHAHNLESVLQAWVAGRATGVALVCTAHLDRKRGARLMGLADRLIVLSDDAQARLAWARSAAVVVRQGVLGGARAAAMDTIATDLQLHQPALVSVCGLYRHKGVYDLLHVLAGVLAEHPDTSLYIVGEGPERAGLEEAVRVMGLTTKVHLVGFQAQPEAWFRQARVFILASHRDSAPLVLLEARAHGAAIVATSVDGIPGLLDDGAAGELVAAEDRAALVRTVSELFSDAPRRRRLQLRARVGLEKFAMSRYAAEVCDVYDQVCTRSSRQPPVSLRRRGTKP